MNNAPFVFFGSAPLGLITLEEMERSGYVPSLVVTGPDTKGRKDMIPPPEKMWAIVRGIPVLQPESIDSVVISNLKPETNNLKPFFFIVAAYGKILPKELLDIPPHGALNVHPSLLPKLRGPSPIRSAILNDDRDVGVSIMLLDEKMDHGPLLAQKKIPVPYTPMRALELEALLATEGARLLCTILPEWLAGTIEPREQNHDLATYCTMIQKEDARIDLNDDPRKNLLKIRAYEGWPSAFTFYEHAGARFRLKILDAHIDTKGELLLDRVQPEGKHEMNYEDFKRGLH